MTRSVQVSLIGSFFLHILTVSALEIGWGVQTAMAPEMPSEASVLFEFIESAQEESEPPPEDTRTISDRNQIVQDLEDAEGEEAIPRQNVLKDEAFLGLAEAPPVVPQPDAPQTPEISEPVPEEPVSPKGLKDEEASQDISFARVTLTPPSPTEASAVPDRVSDEPLGDIAQPASSKEDAGVERLGDVAFNARAHDLGPYIRNLKHKIWLKWFPLAEFKYNVHAQSGKTVVAFKVHRDGSMTGLEAVEHTGDDYLKAVGLTAVSEAGPFGALPEGFETIDGEDTLNVVFTFYYY